MDEIFYLQRFSSLSSGLFGNEHAQSFCLPSLFFSFGGGKAKGDQGKQSEKNPKLGNKTCNLLNRKFNGKVWALATNLALFLILIGLSDDDAVGGVDDDSPVDVDDVFLLLNTGNLCSGLCGSPAGNIGPSTSTNLLVINRSCLDENEAFLATTDSAIKLLPEATKPVSGWKGLEYKAAFPMLKPPGANFYPPDMDKKEFKLWNDSLTEKEQNDAMGFFTVIKRHSEFSLDSSSPNHAVHGTNHLMTAHDLYSVPYSKEYNSFLRKAAELLHEAGDLAGSPSLKRLLHSKADAFLICYRKGICLLDLAKSSFATENSIFF
ncbi:nudix hydrolase 3-like [Populus alba]|uniref:nudix hydrolase 3-like n=1 Tax=Populus alba TaxID=43335 RepID=UPI003CC74316